MHVKHNIEAHSSNYCFRTKTRSITDSECVFVALVIQQNNAHTSYNIVICGLSGCTIFIPYYLINGMISRKKKVQQLMCVLIFSTIFVWNISHSNRYSATYYCKCTHVFTSSARNCCQMLEKLEFSRYIFEKYLKIKFHENPPSRRRVFSMRTDRQTYMTKLRVFFFAILRTRLLKPAPGTCTIYITMQQKPSCQDSDMSDLHRPNSTVSSAVSHVVVTINTDVTWDKN